MENVSRAGMKASTVKTVIKYTIDKWLDTIEDESLRSCMASDIIVTGGCIASLLMGDGVNDYDVYFRTKETAFKYATYACENFNSNNNLISKVKDYTPFVKETQITNINGELEDRIVFFIKSAGMAEEDNDRAYDYFESLPAEDSEIFISGDPIEAAELVKDEVRDKKKSRFRPVFLTDNAVTLSDKVQVIIRFWGEPSEIHRTFDYAHAMCYYDYAKNYLHLPQEALECMLSKTLIYNGSLYPIASLFRMRKFIKRGWRISAGQILKIVLQLEGKPLTDTDFLKEQLMGVDVAYMQQLISILRNEKGRVDATYIIKLIDKVFED